MVIRHINDIIHNSPKMNGFDYPDVRPKKSHDNYKKGIDNLNTDMTIGSKTRLKVAI